MQLKRELLETIHGTILGIKSKGPRKFRWVEVYVRFKTVERVIKFKWKLFKFKVCSDMNIDIEIWKVGKRKKYKFCPMKPGKIDPELQYLISLM